MSRVRYYHKRQPSHPAPWTEARVFRLSELWRAGPSVDVIAEQLALSRSTVRTRITELRKKYPDKFPYREDPT